MTVTRATDPLVLNETLASRHVGHYPMSGKLNVTRASTASRANSTAGNSKDVNVIRRGTYPAQGAVWRPALTRL